MFAADTYAQRRADLKKKVKSGIILLAANSESPMNYKDNVYPYRQDSSFLYYCGLDQPGLVVLMDCDSGEDTLLGTELSMEDIIWTGPKPNLRALGERVGIKNTKAIVDLATTLQEAIERNRKVHYTPPYRHDKLIALSEWMGTTLAAVKEGVSTDLIKAIIAQRSIKTEGELLEIDKAVTVSGLMHRKAMQMARPGMKESQIAGVIEGIAIAAGGRLSFPAIITVNGQTLHNHYHGNTLQSGQLLLNDFGAANELHYAGDITRTYPVDKQFTEKQREVYQVVLDSQMAAIEALKPGVANKDIHLLAAKTIFEGLSALGLLKGDAEEAIEEGVHALFFPHGLGHMLGLDVHDMEDLGENLVGYDEEIERSTQFGLSALRLGKKLEAGNVITVEPGIYFIPELIEQWKSDGKFKDFINYKKLDDYLDFGGIRIEDDVAITKKGYRVLGKPIPKTVAEVEEIRGRAF
ncbi:MAG: aminopeptidase P family protein [Saprospiraceae bacterium]